MVFFFKHAIFSILTGCVILSLEPATADSECVNDVVMVRHLGGASYNDNPVTILSQNSDEVTFKLSQEWTTDNNLDHLFVSFKEAAYGSPKCLAFADLNSTWESDSLTTVCTQNSKLALVEVWASDSTFTSGLDTATLPGCACDAPDNLPPMVKYTFTMECVSTCASAECVAATTPVITTTTPEVSSPSSCDADDYDNLHAVCENLAIHAHTITFASGEETRVVGDIGTSPGTSITGVYLIKPGGQVLRKTDAETFSRNMWNSGGSYNAVTAISSKEYDMGETQEIGGMTFFPGTYRTATAINFVHGTTVTLDALGDENAQFVFQAGTTFVTAADTYFVLKGKAKAKNVIWAVGTSATLGARSIVEGSILAEESITFGTMAELRGCAIAQAAVTFESRGYVNVQKNSGDSRSACGACEDFALHARTTITFASDDESIITNGDIGVSPGTSITGLHSIVGGSTNNDSADFATSVMFNHADLRSRRSDETYWGVGAHEIGGDTFYPGTYRSATAINFAHGTTVTLDGRGDESAMFLFQAGSTFVTAADTSFILQNGAKAENVVWALGTAATLGARSVVAGSIFAGTAITMGENAKIEGCAIAMTAATFEHEGYVTVP
jgi:hypothetical protein